MENTESMRTAFTVGIGRLSRPQSYILNVYRSHDRPFGGKGDKMKAYHLNNIPDELYREMKIEAAKRDISVRIFILASIRLALPTGETSPDVLKRIIEGNDG